MPTLIISIGVPIINKSVHPKEKAITYIKRSLINL